VQTPPLHYDFILGRDPVWRRSLTKALQGDETPLRRHAALVSHTTPSVVTFLIAGLEYAKCGQQVYACGPQLQRMLTDTRCSKVPASFLRMPHRCLYVALPDCPWELWGGPDTGMHKAGGFYMLERGEELLFAFWGLPNDKSRADNDDATAWLTIKKERVSRTTTSDGTELLDFEAYVEEMLGDPSRDSSDIALAQHEPPEDGYRTMAILVRLGLNLILYVNSLSVEQRIQDGPAERGKLRKAHKRKMGRLKSPHKRRKAEKAFQRTIQVIPGAVVIWLGESIERASVKPGVVSGRTNNWTFRRGHWHYYWTGPRTDEHGNPRFGEKRILKWVAPKYRDIGQLVAAQGREYRFEKERPDWEGQPPKEN